VIDTRNNNVVVQAGVGLSSLGPVAVSPDGRSLYVASGNDSVSVIDTWTNTRVGDPIPAGVLRHDAVLSPDGRYLYVSHYDGGSVPPADLVIEPFDAAAFVPELLPDVDALAESAKCSCAASDDNPY
jgi:YVTN family beta-propeller protein